MNIANFFRFLIISFEFVILLTSCLVIINFSSDANIFASELNLSEEALKYLILLPITIFAWITKESFNLLFPEKESAKILVNWPDFRQLKMNFYISMFYAFVFCLFGLATWFTKNWLNSGISLILFATSSVGLLYIAGNIYLAKISILEIINRE